MFTGIMRSGGTAIRERWGCDYCKEYDHLEARHPLTWGPVVQGVGQSTRCNCGRKLRRITS